MLANKLKKHRLILASGSPRRQKFFKQLDLDFKIDVREVEETYPDHLQGTEITDYLSILKAKAFTDIAQNEIVITSDTLVWKDNIALGKAKNKREA